MSVRVLLVQTSIQPDGWDVPNILNKARKSYDCSETPTTKKTAVVFSFWGDNLKSSKYLLLLPFTCSLLTATAHAEIPTVQYVLDFYERQCGLPAELDATSFFKEELDYVAGEPVAPDAIAAQWAPMTIVDWLNGGSSYASQLTTDNVVSVGYLQDTLNLIDSPACCLGGVYDMNNGQCIACSQTWLRESTTECLDEGKYRDGNSCRNCPDGYVCPAGTNGKSIALPYLLCNAAGIYLADDGTCQACPENALCPEGVSFLQGCVEKYYIDGNSCLLCPDGYMCDGLDGELYDCDAGYYCVAGEQFECEYGPGQCPGNHHAFEPDTIACDNTPMIPATSGLPDCTAEGVYRNGTTCATCPDGSFCPAGTNGMLPIVDFVCFDTGVYLDGHKCSPCPDGMACPAGQNTTMDASTMCLDEGQYLNNHACEACPDGYACPAGTNTTTQDFSLACLGFGIYLNGDKCEPCPDGYTCRAGQNDALDSSTLCLEAGVYLNRNTGECAPCGDSIVHISGSIIKNVCFEGENAQTRPQEACTGADVCLNSNHHYCSSCPKGYDCTDAWLCKYAEAVCLDEGLYRNGSSCRECGKGYSCPEGTDTRTAVCLDEGLYKDGTECKECPLGNECPEGTDVRTATCLVEGVYKYGNECATCPDGYACPADVVGIENCGPGYYCTGGIRTACAGGVEQCPGNNHISETDTLVCGARTFTN